MLVLAMSLKLVAEVALLALLGQALLGWLAGPARHTNPFWRLLDWVSLPPRRLVAWLGARRWPESRQRLAAGALLLGLWLAATLAKVVLCLRVGVQACR